MKSGPNQTPYMKGKNALDIPALTASGMTRLNSQHRGLPFSDREDVLQDSLIDLVRVVEKGGRVDNPAAFLAVIIDRTAATRAVQLTQLREHEAPVGDTRTTEWENYHDVTTIEAAIFAADFDAGVRALPEYLRDVFLAIDVRGMSQDEYAALLRVDQATISRRLDTARDLMKEALS